MKTDLWPTVSAIPVPAYQEQFASRWSVQVGAVMPSDVFMDYRTKALSCCCRFRADRTEIVVYADPIAATEVAWRLGSGGTGGEYADDIN